MPAHTRMASGSKCPARALATHFEPTTTLTGFDRIAFCQLGGRARERGLSRGQRGRFTSGRSALAPSLRSPHAERPTGRVRPGPASVRSCPDSALQPCFSHQQGNPLKPGSPGPRCFKVPATVPLLRDGPAVLTFKPTANPSPIAVTAAAKAPAAPAPQLLRLRPAGRFRSPSDFLLLKKSIRLRVRRIIFPGVGVY